VAPTVNCNTRRSRESSRTPRTTSSRSSLFPGPHRRQIWSHEPARVAHIHSARAPGRDRDRSIDRYTSLHQRLGFRSVVLTTKQSMSD
jgi:hypothetical protein